MGGEEELKVDAYEVTFFHYFLFILHSSLILPQCFVDFRAEEDEKSR